MREIRKINWGCFGFGVGAAPIFRKKARDMNKGWKRGIYCVVAYKTELLAEGLAPKTTKVAKNFKKRVDKVVLT